MAAFAFLTRIPVWSGPLRDEDLGRSVAFFPLVGLVLGLALAGAGTVAADVMSPMVAAVLLAALLAGLTGGLHLDGFADVFDALGGGRGDRARMLELMRDSRIGAHGAAALALLIAAKVAALTQVVERHDLLTLLAFPTVARWAVTPLIVFFPYARAGGPGTRLQGRGGRVSRWASRRPRRWWRSRRSAGASRCRRWEARRSCCCSACGCAGGWAG